MAVIICFCMHYGRLLGDRRWFNLGVIDYQIWGGPSVAEAVSVEGVARTVHVLCSLQGLDWLQSRGLWRCLILCDIKGFWIAGQVQSHSPFESGFLDGIWRTVDSFHPPYASITPAWETRLLVNSQYTTALQASNTFQLFIISRNLFSQKEDLSLNPKTQSLFD